MLFGEGIPPLSSVRPEAHESSAASLRDESRDDDGAEALRRAVTMGGLAVTRLTHDSVWTFKVPSSHGAGRRKRTRMRNAIRGDRYEISAANADLHE